MADILGSPQIIGALFALQENVGRALEFIDRHGDGLIAVGTIGLMVATIALWRSTATLVRDAQDTAKRQLRAYVSVTEGSLALMDDCKIASSTIVEKQWANSCLRRGDCLLFEHWPHR